MRVGSSKVLAPIVLAGALAGCGGATAPAPVMAPMAIAAKASDAPVRGQVLFVHGHGGDPWRFDPLRHKLEADGFQTYSMEFPSMEEDMDWLAWWVRGKVNEIRRQTGATQVDLVCHSMGGLIARYYLEYLDGVPNIRRMVTIDSPHHGVALAKVPLFPLLMISPNLKRQVVPGSPFLTKLNAGDPTPGDIKYTAIGSRHDAYISVKSAFLEGATNFVVDRSSHTSVVSDPIPMALVEAALENGPLPEGVTPVEQMPAE